MKIDFRVGDTLLVRCQGCKKMFEWVVPDEWARETPHFHSQTCRKRVQRRRNRRHLDGDFRCPTPLKRLYREWNEANEEAYRQAVGQHMLYIAYRCACGGIHVGHTGFYLIRQAKVSA